MNHPGIRLMAALLALVLGAAPALADTFRLATLDYPPYSVRSAQGVTGLAAETVRAAFARLGHQVTLEILPWDQALAKARSGETDGLFTIFRTPEREEFLDFSKEVLAEQVMVLLARQDSGLTATDLTALAALSERTFGVVPGVSYGPVFDRAMKEGHLPRVQVFASGEENIRALLDRRVDLAVSNRYGAMDILTRLGRSDEVTELSPPLETVPSHLAFSRKRNLGALREAFDATLADMRRDGTIQRILEDWFTVSVREPVKQAPAPSARPSAKPATKSSAEQGQGKKTP